MDKRNSAYQWLWSVVGLRSLSARDSASTSTTVSLQTEMSSLLQGLVNGISSCRDDGRRPTCSHRNLSRNRLLNTNCASTAVAVRPQEKRAAFSLHPSRQ